MNTLDDLRATLDPHAGGSATPPPLSGSRRSRARAVRARRRQAGTVIGAAAAVVAVVAAVSMLPGRGSMPQPAEDRELLGRTAPATMTSLGYTYDFDRGSENADGAASVELAPSDEPRLLTWAADTSVTVIDPYAEVRISDGTAFDDLAARGARPVRDLGCAGRGRRPGGLHALRRTPGRPHGRAGTTFREQVGGDLLLAAAIGDVGEDEVGIEITVPEGGTVRWSTLCQDAPRGAWTHVDFGARGEYVTGPGCDDPNFDPGAGGSTSSLGRPGDTLEATVYLTDGADGPRVGGNRVRLGLAAYDVAEPTSRVAGYDVPELLEEDGHLWQYRGDTGRRSRNAVAQIRELHRGGPAGAGDRRRSGDQRVTTTWDGGRDGSQSTIGGGVTTFPLMPESRASIAVRPPVPDDVLLGFAYFNRLD